MSAERNIKIYISQLSFWHVGNIVLKKNNNSRISTYVHMYLHTYNIYDYMYIIKQKLSGIWHIGVRAVAVWLTKLLYYLSSLQSDYFREQTWEQWLVILHIYLYIYIYIYRCSTLVHLARIERKTLCDDKRSEWESKRAGAARHVYILHKRGRI